MKVAAKRVRVSGVVQGVGFRWYTRARADELGLVGWVRNLPDGSVEAWIEGTERAVGEMLVWLRDGPPSAHVSDVDARDVEPQGHARFDVQR